MPTYSVKEIAELIEKPAKTVEVYATRKKLVKNSDKKIDTSNPVNEFFLAKHIVQNNTVQSEIPNEPLPESKPDHEKKNGKDKSDNTVGSALMQVEYAIKKLTAQKIQKDVQLKDIEIKKKNNELVDLEQTMSIVRAYSESLKKGFVQDMNGIILEVCSRYDIPSDKAGKYYIKIIEAINRRSKESIAILKELDNE
ncbi:hypothetical protein KAR91_56250 [Candidatus Pacearchaeota archaeon]|nr:hypothetical protein [Candidatus Pacearchaeota archaeon]